MKIATWNVNSVRARLERVVAFLERHRPDLVCLQETKSQEKEFPFEALRDAGYRCEAVGQKSYNGVAILSREPYEDPVRTFEPSVRGDEARFVSVRRDGIRAICVYVPNGQTVGSEAYEEKLVWLSDLKRHLERTASPEEPLVLTGDFNVAPADLDVHDPKAWHEKILCSTPEREALRALVEWGLVDAFRELYPETQAFTWWDYRRLGFPKNKGLRIDHFLMTPTLFARCEEVIIDREERKGKGASDHAPLLATLR